jgi:hypothetical protein
LGPGAPFYINLQAIPELPPDPALGAGQPIRLHYSTAFSQPTCVQGASGSPPQTTCDTNLYAYSLRVCGSTATNCFQGEGFSLHLAGNVCERQLVQELGTCPDARYHSFIVGGPTGPTGPTHDGFIEWHWYQLIGNPAPLFSRFGKLTYMANSTWIKNCYDLNGGFYVGPVYPAGIPLFNPSNHNIN